MQFWYDLDRQIFSVARMVRGRLSDIVPEQVVAKTDFHDLIIRIYGVLGNRLVLSRVVKCVEAFSVMTVLHHRCKEINPSKHGFWHNLVHSGVADAISGPRHGFTHMPIFLSWL